MAKPDFYATRGDVPSSPLEATLLDAKGNVVDLTNATQIRFYVRPVHSPVLKVSGTAVKKNLPGADGKVLYTWQVQDLYDEGDYWMEFEVTFTGGKIVTFPTHPKLLLRVVPDLG